MSGNLAFTCKYVHNDKSIMTHVQFPGATALVVLSNFRISPRAVVFIATATAIYSLGHGLHTLTAVPRLTQPSTLRGTVK